MARQLEQNIDKNINLFFWEESDLLISYGIFFLSFFLFYFCLVITKSPYECKGTILHWNFADVFICHENVHYIGIFASIINIFYKCETMFYFILT